ncbi:BDR-repeat family protein (plasmid) [Borrelia crocidurae DOU]|uniref:BDR-repeat family protein n=2 Tax=Borrelia crocidurae TaxID=29520 RepID=W5SRQ7_9SPIR|nr:BDR-repeat family protein [Borrelia crocidurae DOU]
MYNNYIRRFFMEYIQMEPVITRQMVLNELVKAGINREIADDLSYRYYKNELTIKDLQYLESNFNLKLEILERGLKADIKELDSKIDIVENNLKSDIRDLHNEIDTVENNLNNKIDTKFTELDNKIDKVRDELKSDIASVSHEVVLIRKDMEVNKMELDTKIDSIKKDMEVNKMELNSKFKLHAWMFGTIITLTIGILLTLIFK